MRRIILLLLLALVALTTGCSKQEDEVVAGPYQGYFGDEYAKTKVGIDGSLMQTGTQVSGELKVMVTLRSEAYENPCKVQGTVKGSQVTLKLEGQKEPLEIELTGQHVAKENYYFIEGQAQVLKGEGQIPNCLKALKKGDSIPFSFKTQAHRTEKQS